jgi:hypothetical protein
MWQLVVRSARATWFAKLASHDLHQTLPQVGRWMAIIDALPSKLKSFYKSAGCVWTGHTFARQRPEHLASSSLTPVNTVKHISLNARSSLVGSRDSIRRTLHKIGGRSFISTDHRTLPTSDEVPSPALARMSQCRDALLTNLPQLLEGVLARRAARFDPLA